MIVSTTSIIEGRPARDYLGVVTGEVIVGANIFKDLFASVRDIVGGRSGAYESSLRDARKTALAERRLLERGNRLSADLSYEDLSGGRTPWKGASIGLDHRLDESRHLFAGLHFEERFVAGKHRGCHQQSQKGDSHL